MAGFETRAFVNIINNSANYCFNILFSILPVGP